MSESAGNEHHEPRSGGSDGGRGWGALAATAPPSLTVRRLNRASAEADPDDAGIVTLSDRAAEVADRAFDLADDGREDDGAVAALVALAGGSKQTLENAERFSRQGARHREDQNFNRAHRLLAAAVNGKPVEPPSPQDM